MEVSTEAPAPVPTGLFVVTIVMVSPSWEFTATSQTPALAQEAGSPYSQGFMNFSVATSLNFPPLPDMATQDSGLMPESGPVWVGKSTAFTK
jgi:hypothetical protein